MRIFRRYVPGKSKCAKHSTRPWKTKNIRAEALMFLRSWLHGTKKIFPAHTDERFGKTIASSAAYRRVFIFSCIFKISYFLLKIHTPTVAF